MEFKYTHVAGGIIDVMLWIGTTVTGDMQTTNDA